MKIIQKCDAWIENHEDHIKWFITGFFIGGIFSACYIVSMLREL